MLIQIAVFVANESAGCKVVFVANLVCHEVLASADQAIHGILRLFAIAIEVLFNGEKVLFDESKIFNAIYAANKAVVTGDDAELLIQEKLKQIEAEPKNMNARRALARIYIQGKRFYEAIDVLQQAIEVSGTMDPELDRMLSQTYVSYYDQQIDELRANGQENDAAQMEADKNQFVFDDLFSRVERYPNDLHLRYELGVKCFEYEYYDDALTHLQLAQKSPKDRLWALYYLAMCFLMKGQTDMAIMQLETARDSIPTMDELKKKVVYRLGLCAEEAGDLEKAYQYYKDVYSTDVGFEDLSDRMLAVSQALKQKQG